MGKLIKNICGLFFILCCTNLYAGPENLARYPWTLMDVPVWCGPVKEVNKVLEIEGYVEVEIAFGREKALPTGEIVYAIITYAHKKVEGHIIRTLETPKQQEKCVLNVLFDYKAVPTEPKIES
tara:strand:- start:25 stop:393 length:369 start_codon:yes stop_codon:yes gene_type:complete